MRLQSPDALINAVTLSIVKELHETRGLKFSDLKERLNISNSTLSNRLNQLMGHSLITVEAHANPKGRNFILYKLTPSGEKLAEQIDVANLFKSINSV